MDSAHAELLASEAWRNICDTFLLTVLPLAAAAQGKRGLSLPQWVQRQLSEWLARLLWHISLLLCSFSLGPLRCYVSSVNVKRKKIISVWSILLFVLPVISYVSGSINLPENLHLSQDARFNVLAVALWWWEYLNERALLASKINVTMQPLPSGLETLHLLTEIKNRALGG